MKKLCFITTVSTTVRSFLLPVLSYYAQHTDWELTVVCDDDPLLQQQLPQGVKYYPISMKRGISFGGIAACWKMFKFFRKEKFDLVQYSTPNAAFYASIASALAGVPIRLYHLMGFRYLGFSGFPATIFYILEKITCLLSTQIECVSQSNLTLGAKAKLYPAEKAHIVLCGSSAGVDLKKFPIEHKDVWRQQIRASLGYEEANCVFGFAGRLTGDKGINELISAFLSMKDSNCFLMLIGHVETENTLDSKLMRAAQNHPRISFIPFTSELEKYYAAMDVLVLPSYREGFGNIIIEAHALGIPVITSDIPGPIDAMIPGETGITVPPKDSHALCKAMIQLADAPALRHSMGKNGYRFVLRNFDQERLLVSILAKRRQLLGE